MSGVWKFSKGGVIRLENPAPEGRKVLVHLPTGEAISSYASLERILTGLGWERYYYDVDLLQFHKECSVDLISLPTDFSNFRSVHMYDIVVKNPNIFRVRDIRWSFHSRAVNTRDTCAFHLSVTILRIVSSFGCRWGERERLELGIWKPERKIPCGPSHTFQAREESDWLSREVDFINRERGRVYSCTWC
ncbi:hypothetical protein HHK36_026052 [Tetracentron sinense]|uniref:Uncharacterized protein n=1 Tax=Tetracentron sinense TaxID=13715 RepID=A0A835D3L9_TETSI|nr:hypothetical protein HHK36_026052 [Tetracentron sinense]